MEFLDIAVDVANVERDALEIVKKLRPEWDDKYIKMKRMAGLINVALAFHLEGEGEGEAGLIVRTSFTDHLPGGLISDRDKEVMAMQLGSQAGCCRQLVAMFNNGIVYGFAKGRPLKREECLQDDVIKVIAECLARFHSMNVSQIPVYNRKGEHVIFPSENCFMRNMKEYYRRIPLDIPEVVNMVDFEVADTNYTASDLCYIFDDRTFFVMAGMIPEDSPPISKELKMVWLRAYLETRFEIDGKDKLSIDDEVNKLYLQHEIMIIFNNLLRVCICLSLLGHTETKTGKWDKLPFCIKTWERYRKKKENLGLLLEQYSKYI